jgi:hypothetical protein
MAKSFEEMEEQLNFLVPACVDSGAHSMKAILKKSGYKQAKQANDDAVELKRLLCLSLKELCDENENLKAQVEVLKQNLNDMKL